MTTKQWLTIEVGNEIVMHFLLSQFISSLGFKPMFVPIEADSESVYLEATKYDVPLTLIVNVDQPKQEKSSSFLVNIQNLTTGRFI